MNIIRIGQEAIRLAAPVIILGAGVIGFAGLASMRQPPESRETEATRPLVEVAPVTIAAAELDIVTDGRVVPFREVRLSAEVSGRITRKTDACRAGRYVTAGTPLLEIDERTYQLAVERLREEVEQAQNSLDELEVELQNNDALIALLQEDLQLKKRELDRMNKLFSRGVLNESEVDEYRAKELSARNALTLQQNNRRKADSSRDRLRNSLDLARTRLAEAELELQKSKIVAPIDGVVVTESVEEGNYVSAGTELVTIDDTSAAEVRTTLRMDELNWVWQQGRSSGNTESPSIEQDYQLTSTPATISYRLAGQDYSWKGELWRYEGIGLNEKTRTVPVRILVSEPRDVRAERGEGLSVLAGPKALVRGMYVEVTLHTRPNVGFLSLPDEAVQPGNVVWVINGDTLRRVNLRNVRFQGDRVLVPEGGNELAVGDEVVVTPLQLAAEGMAVDVQREMNAVNDQNASEGQQG
ncbi:MAG: efflux RND transporter periplasmic adaptor subunit [Rubinisphaera brasiliensis]|uniref:efflux RND transporter periplasmic adaptor subunit n=1 Tax=Rubinisphaera brasiliensis TaxID=119 RepID=UPI00391AB196|nr:HlyD family efflux transporter periplasmic adaptor subunit [bacterium]